MSEIFISYAREDLERTRQLANALGSLGWNVFIDRRIPAGKTWADYIGKELDGAKCVIVIWSKASLGSRFVKLEANNALAKEKLIPVLIEDVSPPFEFGDLHAADLSKWDGDKNKEEFINLVTDIESLIGSRPKGEAVSHKSKVEEEKRLKEEAETRRKAEVEEEKRLKEAAEARRKVEEEKRLKEEAAARRKLEEEKRKFKGQTEKAKKDKKVVAELEKTTLASTLKKARYKIALIVAGIIAVTVIVILVVNSGPLVIGQKYKGGIIFYIDASGKHGLIAAQTDQSTGIEWGAKIKTGAIVEEIGSGRRNTDIIVAKLGDGNYAAKLCADLVLNGYSDWFLPSKDELNQLYLNKDKVGGFSSAFYWSSTEVNNTNVAWKQYFNNGPQRNSPKYNTYYVRAVRAF